MTKLRVRISIDEFGLPGNRFHCAIANALAMADPDLLRVKVDENTISFNRRSTQARYVYVTPVRAAQFIREFDRKLADPRGNSQPDALNPFYLNLSERNLLEVREFNLKQRTKDVQREMQRALGRASEKVKEASPELNKRTAAIKATPRPTRVSISAKPRKSISQRV